MRKKLQEAIMSTPDLPVGFVELEYLESSEGKQYFLIDEPFTKGSGVYADIHLTDSRFTQNGYYLYCYNLLFNTNYRLYAGLNGAARYIHNDEYGNHGSLLRAYSTDGRYTFGYNFRNSGQKILTTSSGTYTQAITAGYVKSASKFPLFCTYRVDTGVVTIRQCTQRVLSMQMTQGDAITRDLVPVLDAEGTPCLHDKISRQCFYNQGAGVFGYKIKATGEVVAPVNN
jgi:hypothetical protein